MLKIKRYLPYILIFLIPFFVSSIFRYNYVDFHSNGSIVVAQMLTAESIAREHNYDVSEYHGSAGADVFEYKGEWYVPHSPLNSLLSSVPLFFSNGLIAYFDLRVDENIDHINQFNSYVAGALQSAALGAIALLLYILFRHEYKIKNKVFLYSVPLMVTLSTFLLNYAVSFSNHILVAAFCLASWYFFIKKRYVLAGLMIGISFLGEYQAIFLGIFYLMWMIYKRSSVRSMLNLLVPIVIFVFVLLLFNTIVFDHPLHFGQILYDQYNTSIANKAGFSPHNIINGLGIGVVSPLKGIIWYIPILILSVIFLIYYRKKFRKEYFIIGAYFLFMLLFYSLWDNCWGDSPLGPRHLISIVPLLMIPLAYPFAHNNIPKYQKIYLLIIVLWGIVFFWIAIVNVFDGLPKQAFVECRQNEFTYYEKVLGVMTSNENSYRPIVSQYILKE